MTCVWSASVLCFAMACGGAQSSTPASAPPAPSASASAVPATPPPAEAAAPAGAPAEDRSKPDAVIAMMTRLADRACQCADTACVDRVTADLQGWGKQVQQEAEDGKQTISDDEARRFAAVAERFSKCSTDVYNKDAHKDAGSATKP